MSNEPMSRTDLYDHSVVGRVRTQQGSVVAGAAVVAASAVLAQTLLTITGNLPFEPLAWPAIVDGAISVITPLSLAVAAGVIAFTVDDSVTKVGLLFIAAFALLGSVSPATGLPAILGTIAGGTVALLGASTQPAVSYRRVPLVGSALLGMAISLCGQVGLTPDGTHSIGVGATLLAVALLAVEMPVDRLSGSVGLLVAGGLLTASVSAPFAAGATLLVGFSITNQPVLVVTVAVAGGVAALVSGVRSRAVLPVAGCTLCLFAGVPTTPTDGAALVVGLTLVLCRDAVGEVSVNERSR